MPSQFLARYDRWQAGCRNAAALWRELQGRGFPGQYSVVRDWGTQRRRQDPPAEPRGTSDKPVSAKPSEPPTPRRAVRRLAGDPITRFCEMVKGKSPDPFDDWLREAEVSALSPFAAGIRRDEDAVRAALSEPWSSGRSRARSNRLKATKRTMYGRAGFDLLRARVFAHA